MRAVRRKDTGPELTVRKLLHHMGFRYRLQGRDLPGRPDIVFRSRRKAVFVHGCFWHGHDCRRGSRPSSNADFWSAKLDRNKERDAEQLRSLAALGWKPMVVWECETRNSAALESRLRAFLSQ